MDRHELLVSLAQSYANEHLPFAEIYRVPVRLERGARAVFVVMALVVVAVALITRSYAVANRVVIALLAGGVCGAVMIRRRFRGQPNLVLLAIGDQELVGLRVTFLTGRWKVIDSIGRWPRSSVEAQHGADVCALDLTVPGEMTWDLNPLAVSHDATSIVRMLVRDEDTRFRGGTTS